MKFCQAVVAQFYFGPQFCNQVAIREFSDGVETFATCAEHDPERQERDETHSAR